MFDLDFTHSEPARYGNVGSAVTLFEGYKEWNQSEQAEQLREAAHTTTDFATYLGSVVRKKFFTAFDSVSIDWERYAEKRNVKDFREDTLVGLGEFSQLLEVQEEADYKYGTVGQRTGPSVKLRTYGRLMQISRKALINDDMGHLARIPEAMGRAAARTLAKDAFAPLLTNPTAYDGTALFHINRGNLGSAALDENSFSAAVVALMTQTNQDGERLAFDQSSLELVVPTNLMFTARRILNSAEIATSSEKGTSNALSGVASLHVEQALTDTNDWYLHGRISGESAKPVVVAFLNGKEQPDLMRKTTVQQLGGGAYDPYNLEVDSLDWKVRHDWGVSVGEPRTIYKAVVA